MVSVRDTVRSVPIGTPSTLRPAIDHVPVSDGLPPEHWPVTRASSARMLDQVAQSARRAPGSPG